MRSCEVRTLTSEFLQLQSRPIEQSRPSAVTAVSSLFAIVAVVSVVFACLMFLDLVPLSYGSTLLPAGLEQSGPIAFLLYAAVTAIVAIGLWRAQRWARRIAVLIAIAGVVFVVPGISSAVVDFRVIAIIGKPCRSLCAWPSSFPLARSRSRNGSRHNAAKSQHELYLRRELTV
jgi:hypothetical protein